jgi:topoisomerase-4 subunit A
LSNHYEDNILVMERFDSNKVWTAALYDAGQKFPYIKRFRLEAGSKHQHIPGENELNTLYLLSEQAYPRFEVIFGGNDEFRPPLVIDAASFIGVKSFKAKGKRITTFEVSRINELEPVRFPEETPEEAESNDTEDNGPDDAQPDLFK